MNYLISPLPTKKKDLEQSKLKEIAITEEDMKAITVYIRQKEGETDLYKKIKGLINE